MALLPNGDSNRGGNPDINPRQTGNDSFSTALNKLSPKNRIGEADDYLKTDRMPKWDKETVVKPGHSR